MALRLITAPNVTTGLPVSVADAKTACRFDPTELDADIAEMILDAAKLIEHETGQCLMAQTWEVSLDVFTPEIRLDRVPVTGIIAVIYRDTSGVEHAMPPTDYVVDVGDGYGPHYLLPAYGTDWPATRDAANAVRVRYTAGYASPADVPTHLKRLVKTYVRMMIDDPAQLAGRLTDIDKIYTLW